MSLTLSPLYLFGSTAYRDGKMLTVLGLSPSDYINLTFTYTPPSRPSITRAAGFWNLPPRSHCSKLPSRMMESATF
ncbi:hypothetical protein A0H81_02368 [Grifola frondosa]|uniref:Uncharacterized protein n=1 Tax=Grifola frondosa TaxID=5627 RepID=A0A1C7MMQ2_GRIFR|nr:hypothetical protein A0H81_02368 [Grifola frondosa]